MIEKKEFDKVDVGYDADDIYVIELPSGTWKWLCLEGYGTAPTRDSAIFRAGRSVGRYERKL